MTGNPQTINHIRKLLNELSDEESGVLVELITSEAVVTQAIEPGRVGQVKFQASWWAARCNENISILPGQIVSVVGRGNATTLLVKPVAERLQADTQDISVDQDFVWQSSTRLAEQSSFTERGDRIIALSSGGAFLGGLIAQVPGAVVGALLGAVLGMFGQIKTTNAAENL